MKTLNAIVVFCFSLLASCRGTTGSTTKQMTSGEIPTAYAATLSPFIGDFFFDRKNCTHERYVRRTVAKISFKDGRADGTNIDGLYFEYDGSRTSLDIGSFGVPRPHKELLKYRDLETQWYSGPDVSSINERREEAQNLDPGFIFKTNATWVVKWLDAKPMSDGYNSFTSEKWTKNGDGSVSMEFSERYGKKPFKSSTCRLVPRDPSDTSDEYDAHRQRFAGDFRIDRAACNLFEDHTTVVIKEKRLEETNLDYFTLVASGGRSTDFEAARNTMFIGREGKFDYSDKPFEFDAIASKTWSKCENNWSQNWPRTFTQTDSLLRNTDLGYCIPPGNNTPNSWQYSDYRSNSWTAVADGAVVIETILKYKTDPVVRKSCRLIRR